MLQAVLEKNIELYDHETIVDANNRRLIGFGRYAGIVGAYNGFRAFGIKYDLFTIPKAETLQSKEDLIVRLKRQTLPNIKIVLTGHGKVGMGAKEILDGMKVKQVSTDDFLNKIYTQPVYTQIDVLDYNKRKDRQVLDNIDFYKHPENYESDFMRFAAVTDYFIAGHFFGDGSPFLFTREDAKKDHYRFDGPSKLVKELQDNPEWNLINLFNFRIIPTKPSSTGITIINRKK
mgnify:CR=1 FL=1